MSEFDILKNAHKYVVLFLGRLLHFSLSNPHRFLREDEEEANTWEDKVAAKYYESLYREFAICDLKHYKSGNVRFVILFYRLFFHTTTIIIIHGERNVC
jgi:hypothetical protein